LVRRSATPGRPRASCSPRLCTVRAVAFEGVREAGPRGLGAVYRVRSCPAPWTELLDRSSCWLRIKPIVQTIRTSQGKVFRTRLGCTAVRRLPALVALGLVGASSLLLAGCGQRSHLSIKVGGKAEQVPTGTTLAQAIALFHLRVHAGSLLDVQGNVLRRGIFPGAVLVNSHRVRISANLRSGDRIRVHPGRDHRERLERHLVPVANGVPADPQFVLSRTPGTNVIVRGSVSHELVSVTFRPDQGRQEVERAVALTFDDGPSRTSTPQVVAVLRRFHVPATFSVVGYLAAQYPQVIALERRDGMTVGNHTYNHPQVPPFAQLPAPLVRDEIFLGAQSVLQLGIRPHLLRPPGGSYSPAIVREAKALDERVVLWSVDPTDWIHGVTAHQIASRVLAAIHPGSIVILHDGGGDRTSTIKALPKIIRGIRRRHLRLVAVPTQ
jgi:peptidoglycan/xylan/chitin deacetylase (PgdA/CDA1 family)